MLLIHIDREFVWLKIGDSHAHVSMGPSWAQSHHGPNLKLRSLVCSLFHKHLGAHKGPYEPILGQLFAGLDPILGPFGIQFGSILDPFGYILNPFWAHSGPILDP